jgi:hypothetical protein
LDDYIRREGRSEAPLVAFAAVFLAFAVRGFLLAVALEVATYCSYGPWSRLFAVRIKEHIL